MSQEYYHFSHYQINAMTIDPHGSFSTLYYHAFAWPFIGTLVLAALAAVSLITMLIAWVFAGKRGLPDWVAGGPALIFGMSVTIGLGAILVAGVGGIFVILYYAFCVSLVVAFKLFIGWAIFLFGLGLAALVLKIAMALLMVLFFLIGGFFALIFGLTMPFRKL
jgi:hypothetical protein